MEKVKELEARLEAAKEKREAIGKALESARIAFESIKYQHEAALKEQNDIMAELIKAMQG